MTPRGAIVRWSLIGALSAIVLLTAQASAVGGWEGLLQVGELSDLRPLIEGELGEIPLSPGPGHDGQIYYAVALDLDGSHVPDLLDHGAYRYRRIAYPLLASAFGLLDGKSLLYGMLSVTVIATGLAAGTVASLARVLKRSDWWALVVILNPGVWLSVRLLTADVLALAGMGLGLLGVVTYSRWTPLAFSLSGLAKDVFLLTPAGLAMNRHRHRWLNLALPLIALVLWMAWLTISIGEGFSPRGNLDWPLLGMIEAVSNWTTLPVEEWLYLGFAVMSVLGGLLFGIFSRSWLRWPILGWSALGVVSSHWVWDLGNNAARAFAPIAILVALSALQTSAGTDERSARGVTAGPE